MRVRGARGIERGELTGAIPSVRLVFTSPWLAAVSGSTSIDP